jgi:hypothetical protein
VERIVKHGVHSRWSLEEEIPGGILQVPCVDRDDINDPEI